MSNTQAAASAGQLYHVTADTPEGPRGFARRFAQQADAVTAAIDRWGEGTQHILARHAKPDELPRLEQELELRRIEFAQQEARHHG
jgi:hypothetical protein